MTGTIDATERRRRIRRRVAVIVLLAVVGLVAHLVQSSTARDVTLNFMLTDIDVRQALPGGGHEFMTREKLAGLTVVLRDRDQRMVLRSHFDFERPDGRLAAPFAATTGEVSLPSGEFGVEATLRFRTDAGEPLKIQRESHVEIDSDGRIDVRI